MTSEPTRDAESVVFDALYGDTWTDPKPSDPNPDWHRRFAEWQARHAARLAVAALADAGLLIDGDASAYDERQRILAEQDDDIG